MLAHQVSTNLVMVGFFVLGSYNLYISLSQFSAFLYFSSGFITIAECVFRTAFIIARSTFLQFDINNLLCGFLEKHF